MKNLRKRNSKPRTPVTIHTTVVKYTSSVAFDLGNNLAEYLEKRLTEKQYRWLSCGCINVILREYIKGMKTHPTEYESFVLTEPLPEETCKPVNHIISQLSSGLSVEGIKEVICYLRDDSYFKVVIDEYK